MSKSTLLAVIGLCVIVSGMGTGLVLYLQHSGDTAKPVHDRVTQSSANTSLTVSDSSPSDGLQQTGMNTQGIPSNASGTGTSNPIDPSTFGQYNTPKYQNGVAASYADIVQGTGATLSKPGQKAIVAYKGWLTNGTLFDETKVNAQGQTEAFSFTYGANPPQVIPGFSEGVSDMKVGGTRLLIVPPSAGYGGTAQGSIPAHSVLIFQVQLLAVQ